MRADRRRSHEGDVLKMGGSKRGGARKKALMRKLIRLKY
jgi:hypothetical protein